MKFSFSTLLRRRVLVALVAVTALLGGSVVYVQAAKITTTYRTAVVTYGTITQSIGMAGNLAPVSLADLNFASSGTVQSLDVAVGQSVTAGTTLAALDPTLLSAQLLQAQATLATANAKLAQDNAGPTAQSLSSTQNSVNSAQVSVNNAQTSLNDTQAINAQAVAAAQAAAEPAIATAQASVNAEQTTIATDTSKLTADTATMNLDCNATPPAAGCSADTTAVAGDQSTLTTDQNKLAIDQAGLASAQAPVNAATVKAQQSNDQAAAQLASAKQQLAGAQSSLAALYTPVSPQTIDIDTAQIEIDQVNVNTFQHELNGATLTAPIAGIVSQVNITAGQAVSGGGTSSSSTNAIVIYTPGAYQMTGTISDSQVNLVAVGQTVQVAPAGSSQAILGKVTSISPAATITSGVATFGVTARLTDASNSIKPGISATASVVVNQVVHVLTVPTSAVHTTAAGSTVQVMFNGVPRSVSVQTGASDPTRTEITSGLQLNETVVIAVITSSVPSSGTGTALGTGGGTRGGGGGTRGTGG